MSGGSKKQTVGYAYALGMHLVLSHGPIDKVMEIQADEKTAFTDANWTGGIRGISAFELFGGIDKEGGIAGAFNLMMGGPTQGVDPYLNAKLPHGSDPIPAYRGVVSMVLQQVYIGTSVYVKKLAFKASRIHVRTTDGIVQWYDAKAEIGGRPGGGVSSGMFIVAGGGATNAVYFNEKIDDNWGPPNVTSSPISNPTNAIAAGDKYLLFNATDVYSTVNGVDISYVGSWSPYVAGGNPIWEPAIGVNGRIIRMANQLLYSLDKGATWTVVAIPSAGQILKCGGVFIIYGEPGQHWWTASDPLTYASWTDQGSQSAQFNSGGFTGASNDTVAMIGGIDVIDPSKPAIVQTADGVTFVPQLMPIGLVGSPFSMIWGGDRWGCVIYDGSGSGTYKVIYKTAIGAWTVGLTISGIVVRGLTHIANYFVVTTATGSKYSPDLASWSDVPGTASISSSNQPWWYVDGVATGHSADMNPAHIIRECLTDPDWGMGYLDSDIDDTSFTYAADVLYAEYFGLSLLWNSQTTVEDFVKEVLKHIDASLYIDRKTGKFKLKLIRNDYNLDALVLLDPSSIEHVADFTRPTFGELTNSLTVKFWNSETDKDDAVTVQDIALAQMQNATINTTITYAGITKADLASRIAQRDLKTISTPIVSCTLYCDRTASDLDIGDPFLMSWPDYQIDSVVMRVVSIAFGNGSKNQVRVNCTEDVYTTPDVPIIPASPGSGWTDVAQPPLPAVDRMPYELPYMEAVQQYGETAVNNQLAANDIIGYVGLALGRPTSDSINANLYVNSGGGYVVRDTVDFSPSCKLTASIGKTDTALNVGTLVRLEDVTDGSWLQIGSELMAFVAIAGSVLTVRRGILDTVPQNHASGALVLFWDNYAANDPTQYSDGETLLLKATPITLGGELALADAPIDSITMHSRMIRPYAPGQFKINSGIYPPLVTGAITVSWSHRDRLLQTATVYLDTTAGSIGPEPGTTYTIRYYNNDTNTLVNTESGITGTSGTAYTPSGDANYRVELESVRDGFISWQFHSTVFAWTTPFLNTADIAWTEADDDFALDAFIPISGALAWTEFDDVFLIKDTSAVSAAVFVDEFNGSSGTALESHAPDTAPVGSSWDYAPDMTLDGTGKVVNLVTDFAYLEAVTTGGFAQTDGVYWEFTATIGARTGGDKHSIDVITCQFGPDTPFTYIYINGPDNTYGGAANKIMVGYSPSVNGSGGTVNYDAGTNPYNVGDTVTVRCEIDPVAKTVTFLIDGTPVHSFDTTGWYNGTETFADSGIYIGLGTTTTGTGSAAPGTSTAWLRAEFGTL